MLEMLKNKKNVILEENGLIYLILAAVISIAIPLKLLLFYDMMGISVNFVAVWLITLALVYLMFASFRNKWIPATLFLAFSVLMFADAAYSSFFNRYLSINMLGAAGLLGGVQESVKEVLKAKYFLLFADALLVFAALAAAGIHRSREKRDSDNIKDSVIDDEGKEGSAALQDDQGGMEHTALSEAQKETVNDAAEKPRKIKKIIGKYIHPFIAGLIIVALFTGAPCSYIIASAANQEFFSYHIKDVVKKALSDGEDLYVDPDDLLISTGTYEKEIDGPIFGIAKDRNLIVIQVESIQNMVVNAEYNGCEITPNLNRLIHDNSIYFDNYYEQRGSGNTSDAEYATNNSLYGTITSYTYGLYANNYFRGLPWQLKEQGYSTAAFHGYEKDFWSRDTAYPGQGFDKFYSELDFEPTEILGMGISDVEFFDQSIDYMLQMRQPFYSFCVTLSNHYPFVMPEKYQSIPILEADRGTIFGNYINSVNYTDHAIGTFIDRLKEAGLYDNSIIAIYGDHFGLTPNEPEIFESVSRYLGKDYDFDNMMNIPFIVHIPGSGLEQTVSISGGHIDFMPTISYLLGLEKLDTLYFGHNMLTAETGFVAEQAYMTKGSFIKDNIIFEMSKDGVFDNSRAWNIKTGQSVPVSECKSDYLKSKTIIDSCEFYLKNDVLRKVLLEQVSEAELYEDKQVISVPEKIVAAGAGDAGLAGTNSREALDLSYKMGYRYIKITMEWSAEGASVMKAADGFSSMAFSDLADWMDEHPDAFLVVEMDKDIVYLMDGVKSKYPDIKRRIIPEVTVMDDYSRVNYLGYGSALFSIKEENRYNEKQILDFIELNPVWAASIPESLMFEGYEGLINEGRSIYIKSSDHYTLELE